MKHRNLIIVVVGTFIVLMAWLLAGLFLLRAVRNYTPPPLLQVSDPYIVLYTEHNNWVLVFLIVPDDTSSEDDRAMFADFKRQLSATGKIAVVGICTQVDIEIYNCTPDFGTIYVNTEQRWRKPH